MVFIMGRATMAHLYIIAAGDCCACDKNAAVEALARGPGTSVRLLGY